MTRPEYLSHLKEFEGFADPMYLDSVGVVTVGMGIALFSEQHAKRIRFFNRDNSTLASHTAVSTDFHNVKAAPKAGLMKGYRRFTKLSASKDDLDAALDYEFSVALGDVVSYCPEYHRLPIPVQYALLDMSFNLGGPKLKRYQNLKRALLVSDWETAARESHRNGIQSSRNAMIASWIRMSKNLNLVVPQRSDLSSQSIAGR
jgi:GH24 family phage-related lysozyme (muramidase)